MIFHYLVEFMNIDAPVTQSSWVHSPPHLHPVSSKINIHTRLMARSSRGEVKKIKKIENIKRKKRK